jgi:hypothetical protein
VTACAHHFVPRFYLARFTHDGTRAGRLFVLDQRTGARCVTTAGAAARLPDFYRIEVPGVAPDEFEGRVARIEHRTARVFRRVIQDHLPPVGDDLEDLVTFVALMAVRTPPHTNHWDRQEAEFMKRILEMTYGNPQAFKGAMARAREAGCRVDGATPEAMLEMLDRSKIEFTSTHRAAVVAEHFEVLRPILATRTWSLVAPAPGAGRFICSDMPAVLYDPTPRPTWVPPGHFARRSEFTMPIAPDLMILGHFETDAKVHIASAVDVAALNNRTRTYANEIYSSAENFPWRMRDGSIGGVQQLLDAIRAAAERKGPGHEGSWHGPDPQAL